MKEHIKKDSNSYFVKILFKNSELKTKFKV